MSSSDCFFCTQAGGEPLWGDERCRIVWPQEAQHPTLCRVVWHDHVKEMTDLAPADQLHLMKVVLTLEQGLRALLAPDKMNLASLGNLVAHLHWHVVPRYADDPHYPNAIWSPRQRDGVRPAPAQFSASLRSRLAALLAK